MKLEVARERSGPLYRWEGGRVVSYVMERGTLVVDAGRAGRLSVLLPRRVFVIDEQGVRELSDRKRRRVAAALAVGVGALLAARRR